MTIELYHPGLRGVIAGETEICNLEGTLTYRGYNVEDLAESASYLEVAYLLLHDDLPSEEALADFRSVFAEEAHLPQAITEVIDHLPLHVAPVDALRTAVSMLGHFDMQPTDGPASSGRPQAIRLLAKLPLVVGQFAHKDVAVDELIASGQEFAGMLLTLIRGKRPASGQEARLNTALVLAAEHEFNAPSYAARIVASAKGDMYSAVAAALGALRGVDHGLGSRGVLACLEEVGDPDRADRWVADRIHKKLPLPGFGHPVYRDYDPRAAMIERYCQEFARANRNFELETVADAVEQAVWDACRLPPNLEWTFARLMLYLGIPEELHVGVFACARVAGWCAHAIEQAESGDVIRPRARYRGAEARLFEPLERRGM
ncbi:citrate/2-methylcitrate synthase [Maioricimonas sp. JC845]|uniref:citrate/2-methylcitrate synthase n=1 Tax=Maioricimonas sp. JC845 TaxID=3232138 RepID=UPI003459E50F